MVEYTHIIISLIASILYTITAIRLNINGVTWGYNLIIVIVVFLIIGSFFKRYLIKNIFNDKMVDEESSDEENVELDNNENEDTDEIISINDEELEENENFFESLGDE